MLPLGNLERQTVKGASAIISLSTFLTWWTGFIEIFIYLFLIQIRTIMTLKAQVTLLFEFFTNILPTRK